MNIIYNITCFGIFFNKYDIGIVRSIIFPFLFGSQEQRILSLSQFKKLLEVIKRASPQIVHFEQYFVIIDSF